MNYHFLIMSKITYISFVLIGILSLASCQSEKHEVLTEEDQQSFNEGSEFYSFVERASMHDGSQDDALDESPCFSISFPFRVELNGTEVRIASASDLEVILRNIENLGIEEFSFRFPLTLIWFNYETVSVSNMQELAELKQACLNELASNNSPITCAEIEFPIKLFIYNVNTQTTNSVNIANKKQLYVFLQNSNRDEVLSFDYPVNISLAGESQMEVNSNNEFATALKTCDN